MTTFKQTVEVDLDAEWVDSILVTGFDTAYGGCLYWLRDEGWTYRIIDGEEVPVGKRIGGATRYWGQVEVIFGDNKPAPWEGLLPAADSGVIGKADLERAWSHVLEKFPHTATASQLRHSMIETDLDIDAEGADVLCQIALLGDIVYG